MIIYNHISPKLSDLEKQMIKHIPPGGNWKNIPIEIPSKRLEQIRRSGGRTTYYGRLLNNKPSYTISTYFHRIGNGCNIHPTQNRIISIREAARLQSFNDNFIFYGSKSSIYKQIGNAVPPLLSRIIAKTIKKHIENKSFIDLFAGAGGMSSGFISEGFTLKGIIEIDTPFYNTFIKNHVILNPDCFINGDITNSKIKNMLSDKLYSQKIGIIIGGPPCQGVSLAGWRNINDSRNQLFNDFIDVVNNFQPEFFVMENVPGLLSMQKGELLKQIISKFEEIGYFINSPIKLKAEDFGVPQKRRRCFIIGSKNRIIIDEIHPLFSDREESLPNPVSVGEAIGSLPPLLDNSGDFERNISYDPVSSYDNLMIEKIDFNTFYKRCLSNN